MFFHIYLSLYRITYYYVKGIDVISPVFSLERSGQYDNKHTHTHTFHYALHSFSLSSSVDLLLGRIYNKANILNIV